MFIGLLKTSIYRQTPEDHGYVQGCSHVQDCTCSGSIWKEPAHSPLANVKVLVQAGLRLRKSCQLPGLVLKGPKHTHRSPRQRR